MEVSDVWSIINIAYQNISLAQRLNNRGSYLHNIAILMIQLRYF
jgi:hypothetical protein